MAKGGVYGCGPVFSKYVLLLLNIVFFVLGIALIVVGGIVVTNTQDFLVILGKTANLVGGIIVAFGCFVFFTAFSGCCGALRESVCLLKTYFGIISVVLFIEVILVILIFTSNIFGNLIDTKGRDTFEDLARNDPDLILKFEKSVQCCGWKAYNDTYTKATVPLECYPHQDTSKPINEGCYTKIDDFFNNYYSLTVGVIVGILAMQFIAEVFAVCIWRNINQEDMYV